MPLPTHAILAITLNCNSRCSMCNIWQNKIKNELQPKEFLKLPSSLKDINITGGEPFLRMDIGKIVKNLKKAAPQARLVVSSNGFLPKVIEKNLPSMLQADPKLALRFSLDGWQATHNQIRGIPHGFNLVLESLKIARQAGVKDLGIGFTIMKKNLKELKKIYEFSRKEKLELSLTLVTDSPIYFGLHKEPLRPDNHKQVEKYLNQVIVKRFQSIKPKDWYRGWFELKLLEYYFSRKRPYICDAGTSFFYLDSLGNIYTCNVKNWKLGSIRQQSFTKIWNSKAAREQREKVCKCHACWMICTAKTNMRANLRQITKEIIKHKAASLL